MPAPDPHQTQFAQAVSAAARGGRRALDGVLPRVYDEPPRAARVVELRFFGGMTADQAAAVLGVSPRTVADEWVFARAWLRRELAAG